MPFVFDSPINVSHLPKRALFDANEVRSTVANSCTDNPLRPIICDCGERAGAVAEMLFHCPTCKVLINVLPGTGRWEWTETQWLERHGRMPAPIDGSSDLEPLDPTEF
jgi:hypothetical protein